MADTPVATTSIVLEPKSGLITNIRDIDALDKLLFVGILFFVVVLLLISWFEPNDGQTFQVISGLLTGFAGAFFGRMKPKGDTTKPADTTTATDGGASGTKS